MKPKAGIPASVEAEVLAKAGANHSVRQIAEWLATEHGIRVGHATVARFLARRRTERADVAKVVVREQLGRSLNADIARLEAVRSDLARLAKKCVAKGEIGAFAKLTELELKAIDRKLHYSGADEPDSEHKVSGGIQVFLPAEAP